jgi:hypothetical protein
LRNPAAVRAPHICRLYSCRSPSISNLYAARLNSRPRSIDLRQTAAHGDADSGEHVMLDAILLAAGVVGLLLTIAYAYACERM